MTSLTDVYDRGAGRAVSARQRLFGMALFGAGTLLVVAAIALATTELGAVFDLDVIGSRHVAGVLAGFGIPAVLLGVFAVLPAKPITRATAGIGATLALFGVALFVTAYPERWLSNEPSFAVTTMLVYGLGVLVTFWCVFLAAATFKTRNDPGGTARIEVTDEGTIRVISADREFTGGSGIGLFGREPDGDVPTQTGTTSGDETFGTEQSSPGQSQPAPTQTPATDGTSAVSNPEAVDEDIVTAITQRGRPDEYCGNCTHFEYVRADGELAPYCGLHGRVMQDMDACDDWDSNSWRAQ